MTCLSEPQTTTAVPGIRNDPVAGAIWMLVSCALLAGVAALGRYLTSVDVHPFQVVFLRVLFAFVTMLPLLAFRGRELFRTDQPKIYIWRVISATIAMTTWFSALALLPVGEVTAISFLTPIFATIGAALFLSEVVRVRRWIATLAGFAGVLIILRPGFESLGAGALLAIVSAFAMGVTSIILKHMTAKDDPDKIVFISTTLLVPMTSVAAVFVWDSMTYQQWMLLFVMGLIATLGHVTLVRAFAATEASIVVGFDFARLPFAVLFGYLALGELIDIWTWVGAGVIFVSTVYIARREARLKRQMAVAGVGVPSPRS